ncbi:MAG TPA: O-antigen ligase family protein [Pyrinomonadaceae bacterium]|nr:O-antigen ligase family protein [Pyrinomonadaceae bacterium]
MNHTETPASVRPVARFLDRVIYFSLLTTIVLTAIPYGTVQPWWIAIFQCMVFLIAILGLIEAIISKRWSLDLLPVAPLLALILFAAIQSLPLFSGPGPISPRTSISADPYNTRLFAIQLFALTLVILLLRRYISNKARLRSLIYVVIGVGVGSALFGIVRQSLQQSPGFLLPALPIGGRSFGQFINRNHFAFLLEMSLGLTLGLIVGEVGRRRRVLFLLPIGALLWVALIYSNSRGGILASLSEVLFLGVLLDPIRHFTKHRAETGWRRFQNLVGGLAMRVFLMACLIGLFAYGVGWVGGEPVVNNFQNAGTDFSQQEMENNTNTSRKEIWSATWQMIRAHPLAGFGFSGYWIGITRYHHASGEITPQQAHNDYLELMASGGLIGCALVACFAVLFVKKARQRLHSPDPYCRAACLGALTGIFGVAIHSFVDFGIHITINALLLFTLIVIAVQNDRLANARAGEDSGLAGTLGK